MTGAAPSPSPPVPITGCAAESLYFIGSYITSALSNHRPPPSPPRSTPCSLRSGKKLEPGPTWATSLERSHWPLLRLIVWFHKPCEPLLISTTPHCLWSCSPDTWPRGSRPLHYLSPFRCLSSEKRGSGLSPKTSIQHHAAPHGLRIKGLTTTPSHATVPSISPESLDESHSTDGSFMTIEADDGAFRQYFDAWPARPDVRDCVFAVATRYFDLEGPSL